MTHGDDEASPFVIHDVTKEAKGRAKWVNDHIWDLNRMQKQPEEVEVCPGEQCMEPYECWYYGYCHGKETGDGSLSPVVGEGDREPSPVSL